MDDRISVKRDWFGSYNFHLVDNLDKVQKLVDICIGKGVCSLDTETTGVDNRIYPDEYFEDGKKTRHGIRTVDRVVGLCMSFDGKNGYYLPLSHEPSDSGNLPWDETWDEITRLVNSCKIIFHHAKFDAEFLYPVTGKEFWKIGEFEDTMLLAKIISPLKSNPAGLKQRTKIDFQVDMVELDELFTDEKKEQLKREKVRYNFALLHPKEGLEYGCSDGIFTYKGWFLNESRLSDGDRLIYNLEKSFSNVMRKMERNRVHVDVGRVQQLYVECQSEMLKVGDLVRDIIEKRTGETGRWLTLNVGSPAQLSAALFTDPEGLKLKPTPEMVGDGQGGFSTEYDDGGGDEEEEEEDLDKPKQYSLKDEILKALHRHYGKALSVQRDGVVNKDGRPRPESVFELTLEYRHYDKMKGSYVEKLLRSHDKYGDVRPSFNQMGTDTTRISCKAGKIEDGYSGVNFQGIPRDSDDDKPELFKQIRTVIIPRPGWFLVKLDYSGEELRVAANMSGDPIWIESFMRGDGDVHSITTRILYGRSNITKDERGRGKRCNFAVIYGGGAGAISRNVGCSMEDGQRHMDNLRTGIPVLMGYVEHQKGYARKHKFILTAFGRKIPIPTIDSQFRAIKKKAERCAINYTIQSTSADILKFAMCLIDKRIRELGWEDRVRYVLTVHDEIVFEIRPEHLMEIIPMLDSWMTFPWALPKAHGRPWVVPLETEPGIDIHWRARFDFFQMTRGTRVAAEELAEDGTFKGKLKGSQLFENGRVYKEIPEFLTGNVWRLPLGQDGNPVMDASGVPLIAKKSGVGASPALDDGSLSEIGPMTSHESMNEMSSNGSTEALSVQTIQILDVKDPTPPQADLTGMVEQPESVERIKDMKLPVSEDKPTLCSVCGEPQFLCPSGIVCKNGHGGADGLPGSPEGAQSVHEDGSGLDDLSLDFGIGFGTNTNGLPENKKQIVRELETPKVPVPEPVSVQNVKPGEKVLRWTFRDVPSNHSMRRLLAICILAEGDVPLRIVNVKDQILVSEQDGIRVVPDRFAFLAGLFGLG